MIGTLLATGLVVVGIGSALCSRPGRMFAGPRAQAVSIALVGLAGIGCSHPGEELGASFTSVLEPRLGVDPMSGYFLFVLGLVGAPAVVVRHALPPPRRRGDAPLPGSPASSCSSWRSSSAPATR